MKKTIIDFSKYKANNETGLLKESFVAQWAADLRYVLSHILSPGAIRKLEEEQGDKKIIIKGKKEDVKAFSDVIVKEKEYAKEYMEAGLGSPRLSDIKLNLEKSIHSFEKTTGLIWPLR